MPQGSGKAVESARTGIINSWEPSDGHQLSVRVTSLFPAEPCLQPSRKRLCAQRLRLAPPESSCSMCVACFLQAWMISGFSHQSCSRRHSIGSPKKQGSERRELSLGNPIHTWEQPEPLAAPSPGLPHTLQTLLCVSLALDSSFLYPLTLLQTQQWEVRSSLLPALALCLLIPVSYWIWVSNR